ncbi:hypothetical protein [Solibacillus sp. FSL H8-0538]|uniref:hypothetical protein n=1 Tax=Solibacillus sp. FSL H8-0538 TaxID=2921400 RepID=UPI0030FAA3F4
MRKCIVIIVCVLIIACSSVLVTSEEKKRTFAKVDSKDMTILATNLNYMTSALMSVSQTLLLYREDLTETEKALFEQSLAKDQLQLNQLEANLQVIANIQDVYTTQSVVHETQLLLGDIMTATNITKEKMTEISNTFNVQSEKMAGLPKSQQGLKQYIDIVTSLNKSIETFMKH